MPDVTVNNPKVQIDLGDGESTTVPAGVRWKVSLIADPTACVIRINDQEMSADNGANTTAHIRTDLFDGDTVKSDGFSVRIRGYRVD